jgi:hypothetical protein
LSTLTTQIHITKHTRRQKQAKRTQKTLNSVQQHALRQSEMDRKNLALTRQNAIYPTLPPKVASPSPPTTTATPKKRVILSGLRASFVIFLRLKPLGVDTYDKRVSSLLVRRTKRQLALDFGLMLGRSASFFHRTGLRVSET